MCDYRVHEHPEAPPAIDFASFKGKVHDKAAVDKLEASYKAALASVPYPKETLTDSINKWQEEASKAVPEIVQKYSEKIDECNQLVSLLISSKS